MGDTNNQVGYAPLFKDGEYVGRIKFTIVGGDIMHPEFEPRTKKASPLYRRIETAFAAEMEASHDGGWTVDKFAVDDILSFMLQFVADIDAQRILVTGATVMKKGTDCRLELEYHPL